ncbi:MAG: nucleotidyltransferase domain-containing protein [Candidatus Diapherotrites archaeon]|uniref:Nucleotidyltransferase domain-containing protein n=1 Tax=Candidatus Iainarchaeum sp. TaxID=3101447 RepID=A0A8T3YKW4_9ARCH|nr:nucleotidyltransferase domain-containing protein [Candidatus Diapherotrites archaeon]
MAELSRLLGPFNLQIFELLITENASVRGLAKKTMCSPAKITQFVDIYSKNKLITVEKNDNRKIIALNKSNPLVKEIITLIYTNKILGSRAFLSLKKASDSIGLYGSAVDGTVDKQSDIDLWIVSDSKKRIVEAGKLRQEFSKEIGREVSLKFFTPQDIQNLKQKDRIFYNELENKSKILHGEGF